MNALKKEAVGDYLNAHFVAAYQKVGTFRLVNGQKQGGNVASYFCTPDGEVLHAVAGPVNAAALLREARWAVETWKLAQLESQGDRNRMKETLRRAHADRFRAKHVLVHDLSQLTAISDRESRVHLLLALAPLAKLENTYDLVFEKVLGEKVSTNPVNEGG